MCELQGTGLASPYLNQEVIISGLVIVDLERIEPGGFVILDETCALDGGGSRGLIISVEGGGGLIDLGDEVQVRGTVRESAGESRLETNLRDLDILSLNNPLPGPVNLGDYLTPPLVFGYEKWEGQLVAIPLADIVDRKDDPERIQILPRIFPDPSAQLVCFQKEMFLLRINEDLLNDKLSAIQAAGRLEDVVGFIRQDQDGYFLQLIQKPNMIISEKNQQTAELFSADPVLYIDKTPTPTSKPTITPSKTPQPTFSALPTPSPTIIPSPTNYPIHLLITEIMPNPAGEEPGGEWIEIYNPDGGRLPLDGIKIGDALSPSGKEGLLGFPEGFFIYGGQALVIANRASIFNSRYGFIPDFELVDSDPRVPDMIPYDSWGRNTVKLSNSGDEVLLVDPWDQVVDLVVYGKTGAGGFSPPIPAPDEGHSLERYPPEGDSDQAGDWRERSSPSPGRLDRSPPTLPATQTSNPTSTSTCSPTPTALTETPIPETTTVNPTASLTTTQIPLTTDTPVQSLTPTPEPSLPWTPSTTPTPLLSATFTAVSSHTPTSSLTPTPEPSLPWTPSTTPTPLLSATFTAVPSHTPTSSLTPYMTLLPTMTETSLSTLTVTPEGTSPAAGTPTSSLTLEVSSTSTATTGPITVTPSATRQFTPFPTATPTPVLTPSATPGPMLVINEILADPDPIRGDSNGDGVVSSDDDEFLELVNISGQELDLSGWQVFDEIRLRYTFPEGTSLAAGCGLVVFGGGEPAGDFGGSLVFTAGSLGLNNTGDLITLLDSDGLLVTSLRYGSEGNQDQSLTRVPDLYGLLPLILHSEVPDGGGALYSPGTRVDGSEFGDCP